MILSIPKVTAQAFYLLNETFLRADGDVYADLGKKKVVIFCALKLDLFLNLKTT